MVTGAKFYIEGSGVLRRLEEGQALDSSQAVFEIGADGHFDVPEEVQVIGEGVFAECQDLITINFSSSLRELQSSAFENCNQLESVDMNGCQLEAIGDRAFNSCRSLKSIALEDTRRIGTEAFQDCSSLKSVALSSNLDNLGNGAFRSCHRLQSVIIPIQGLQRANQPQFQELRKSRKWAASRKYMTKIREIPDRMFEECDSLEIVQLPFHIEEIGERAFGSCRHLRSLDLPAFLKVIHNNAFEYCSAMRTVEFPSSIESLGDAAFRGCTGITEVVLPEIDYLGSSAFSGCTNLYELSLSRVGVFGALAFLSCEALRHVTLREGLEEIGHEAFSACTSLSELKMPSSMRLIESWAFSGCRQLKELEYQSYIDDIDDDFYKLYAGCKFLTITNPNHDPGFIIDSRWKYEAFNLLRPTLNALVHPGSASLLELGGDGDPQKVENYLPDGLSMKKLPLWGQKLLQTAVDFSLWNREQTNADIKAQFVSGLHDLLSMGCSYQYVVDMCHSYVLRILDKDFATKVREDFEADTHVDSDFKNDVRENLLSEHITQGQLDVARPYLCAFSMRDSNSYLQPLCAMSVSSHQALQDEETDNIFGAEEDEWVAVFERFKTMAEEDPERAEQLFTDIAVSQRKVGIHDDLILRAFRDEMMPAQMRRMLNLVVAHTAEIASERTDTSETRPTPPEEGGWCNIS